MRNVRPSLERERQARLVCSAPSLRGGQAHRKAMGAARGFGARVGWIRQVDISSAREVTWYMKRHVHLSVVGVDHRSAGSCSLPRASNRVAESGDQTKSRGRRVYPTYPS